MEERETQDLDSIEVTDGSVKEMIERVEVIVWRNRMMQCKACGTTFRTTWTPVPWNHQPLVVYHGTIDLYANTIMGDKWKHDVQIRQGSPLSDFGRGFYTTTVCQQAVTWAYQTSSRAQSLYGKVNPAVLELTIDRNLLAGLRTLFFVRGHFDAEDYWSIVWHCRNPAQPQPRDHRFHGQPVTSTPPNMYDVALGPISAFWKQRIATYDGDQVSFHTDAAENVLNDKTSTFIRRVL